MANVPTAEIPTEAARRMMEVSPGRRMALITQMMEELSNLHPGIFPFYISTIGRQFPELTPWMLVEALALQPEQAAAMVRAAVSAAPEQSAAMVAMCVKNLPDLFPLTAIAAAQQRPEETDAILKAIASVLPESRSALERAVSRHSEFPMDVRQVLMEANQLLLDEGVRPVGGGPGSGAEPAPAALPCLSGVGSGAQAPFGSLQSLARRRMATQCSWQPDHAGSQSNGGTQKTASLADESAPVFLSVPSGADIK